MGQARRATITPFLFGTAAIAAIRGSATPLGEATKASRAYSNGDATTSRGAIAEALREARHGEVEQK